MEYAIQMGPMLLIGALTIGFLVSSVLAMVVLGCVGGGRAIVGPTPAGVLQRIAGGLPNAESYTTTRLGFP